MLDMLHDAAVKVRGKDVSFGGLQVILVGDFQQLPPVRNLRYGDPGDYAFQARCFQNSFPHSIVLTDVKRQDDQRLIQVN